MRELLIGVLLGFIISMFGNVAIEDKISINAIWALLIAGFIILTIIFFRPFLRLVEHINPVLVEKFYHFWASPALDANHDKRVQEWKEKKIKKDK